MGKAFVYGDHIDTDGIIPARHLLTSDPDQLALHCMEDLDAEFIDRVEEGDVIVAGRNFGCGSSREHAPVAIKASGIRCVIATSFARIFYRNSFNIGLPILECPEAVSGISADDEVRVDFDTGSIENVTTGQTFQARPFPPFLLRMVESGGLSNYVKERLAAEKGAAK